MPFYLFLRRLRRSPAAVCGLIAIALLVFIALFAPWLAPVDPNWQDAAARLQAPNASTGWAPTATGAICSRA
jgi:peptide/nickel transport system permease protein